MSLAFHPLPMQMDNVFGDWLHATDPAIVECPPHEGDVVEFYVIAGGWISSFLHQHFRPLRLPLLLILLFFHFPRLLSLHDCDTDIAATGFSPLSSSGDMTSFGSWIGIRACSIHLATSSAYTPIPLVMLSLSDLLA